MKWGNTMDKCLCERKQNIGEYNSIYKCTKDKWHLVLNNFRLDRAMEVEINFCPFCGRKLEKEVFDYWSSD